MIWEFDSKGDCICVGTLYFSLSFVVTQSLVLNMIIINLKINDSQNKELCLRIPVSHATLQNDEVVKIKDKSIVV